MASRPIAVRFGPDAAAQPINFRKTGDDRAGVTFWGFGTSTDSLLDIEASPVETTFVANDLDADFETLEKDTNFTINT